MSLVVNIDKVVVDTNTFDTDAVHTVGDPVYVFIIVVDVFWY